MSRFWIVLIALIIGLGALFMFTKKSNAPDTQISGDAKKILPNDHVRGNRNAKVVLIEYGDFQCPGCGSMYPILKELEATYQEDVAFVFRNFPLAQIHPNAVSAARAAEAASNQGKFFEMHDLLFENQNNWGRLTSNQQQLFEQYASQLNLNMDKFKSDYVSQDIANKINQSRDLGKQTFDITGTPSFILQGNKIETPGTKQAFSKLIDEALKNAGVTAKQPNPEVEE